MKKTLFILTLLTTYAGLAIGQARMAPPRSTYFEITGDTPEAFAQRRMAAAQSGPNRVVGTRAIFPRVLVIMANFSDYAFVSTRADVDSMFNASNWTKDGATGSVRQYFYDQSSGAYNPQFDIVGPVTLSHGYAYYGANSGGSNPKSPRAGEMVAEACTLVDDSVNFSQYDLNNDGKVDMVFVLYAGFGENDPPEHIPGITSTNLVWPHYYRISSAGHGSYATRFDGKTIEDYECANELDGYYSTTTKSVVAGIGVLVHEFCHGLGLPDLYISGGNQYAVKTWGKWSILDYGSYNNDLHTPPSLTAYERYFMGWLTPILANQPADVTLAPLSRSNEAYIITTNGEMPATAKTGTFWMLENRRKEGWDRGIRGNGLLLSQIKTWTGAPVNTSGELKIDLLEADGMITVNGTHNDNNWYGKQGDLYPYVELDSITVVPNYPITEITQNADGTISFKVCGGKQTATGNVNDNDNANENRKFVRNGQIYIRKNGKIYTILGHETNL